MSRLEEQVYWYFGRRVTVWHVPFNGYWGTCPWRFSIADGDKTFNYSGVPNYCYTKRSALRRAWWRCRWMEMGTYHQHYKPFQPVV